jgi:hypothetical protein
LRLLLGRFDRRRLEWRRYFFFASGPRRYFKGVSSTEIVDGDALEEPWSRLRSSQSVGAERPQTIGVVERARRLQLGDRPALPSPLIAMRYKPSPSKMLA